MLIQNTEPSLTNYGSDRHTYTYTAIGNCTDLFMRGVLLHLYMASAYHPLSKGSVQP